MERSAPVRHSGNSQDTSDPTCGNRVPSQATSSSQASGTRRTSTTKRRNSEPDSEFTFPRFMSIKHVEGIKVPSYRPRVERRTPSYPTIDGGIIPTRYSVQETKRPDPKPKWARVLKKPDLKTKWKSATKRFNKATVMHRLNQCLKAMRIGHHQQVLKNIEYKPIYQLRDIRRASVMIGSTRIIRPSSYASIDGELTFNDDDSEASTIKVIPLKESENYNISSIESADNNADDQAQSSLDSPISTGGEGRSLRISIGDWPAIFESLEAEAAREALQQEEPTPTEALVTTPFLSNLDARMPPSFEHNPEDSKNWESTRDNSLDTTSPATSMVIVRQHTLDSTCTSNTIRSSIDFFSGGIDYLDNDEQEESEEQQTGSTSHNSENIDWPDESWQIGSFCRLEDASTLAMSSNPEAGDSQSAPTGASHSEANIEKENSPSKPIHMKNEHRLSLPRLRARDDACPSRIPRATTPRQKAFAAEDRAQVAQNAVRTTPEALSAIPIPTRPAQTAQSLDSKTRAPDEPVVDGTSVVDKRHDDESGDKASVPTTTPAAVKDNEGESTGETEDEDTSSWDFNDDDSKSLERPGTVLTGEYRTKKLSRGPTLRIAPSAEYIIMGAEDPRVSTSIVTKRSPPHVRYVVGRGTPELKETQNNNESGSRRQVTNGNVHRGGMGSKDKSPSRKPALKHSTSSLYPQDRESLVSDMPPVPKIKAEHLGGRGLSTTQIKEEDGASDVPKTPTKQISATEGTRESAGNSPTEETPCQKLFPPRTSSLIPVHNLATRETPMTPNDVEPVQDVGSSNLDRKTSTTFDDIIPQDVPAKGEGNQTDNVKLPDSKSSRMLVSFKSIFSKHRSAAEKARTKKLEDSNERANSTSKEPAPKGVKNVEETPNTGKQISKSKSKRSRLSDGATWNKGLRNSKPSAKVAPVPVPTTSTTAKVNNTPASSSSLPVPRRQSEDRIPSFARPTQSAITRAAGFTRASTGQLTALAAHNNARTRRVPGATASGSPQPPNRTQGCSVRLTSPLRRQNFTFNGANPVIEDAERIERIRRCIEDICNQACDGNTADKRERFLRVALSLQQTLSDYTNKDREYKEAEQLYFKKRLSRDIGRNTLFEYFDQIESQLSEELD